MIWRITAAAPTDSSEATVPDLNDIPLPDDEYPPDQRGDEWLAAHGGNGQPAATAAAEANGRAANGCNHAEPKKSTYRPLPAYQPFPLAALPPVLREYVDSASAAIGCDSALVALPALAVTMSAVGNSRAIQLRRGWSEPAVLWAITIMRSGGVKSAGFAAAVDPLLEIQMEGWDEYQRRKEAREEGTEEVRFTSEGGIQAPPKLKEPPCYVTSDATVAAVGELLRENPRGLLLARDELDGWFQSFTRFQQAGATDRPHWLELHGARTLRLDRITRTRGPVAVRRACCSLCGTVQPSVLEAAMTAEAIAAGLGARFLPAMPPLRKRVWTEAQVTEEIEARYRDLLKSLLALPLADPVRRKPHFLHLDSAAKRAWVRFFNEWGERQYAAFDAEAAVLAKLEGYAARLSMLHHTITQVACGIDDLAPITETSVNAGIELVRWFAAEAGRVYGFLRSKQEDHQMRELIEWIERRGGYVTARELGRHRHGSAEDAEIELSELKSAGVGDWQWQPSGPQGGKPTRLFLLFGDETSKKPGNIEVSSPRSSANTPRDADQDE